MRHPNQVVNRNQILDHLWDYEFDSFSNVVDVHIKNLRKKINNNRKKILETIRGIGYKIKDSTYSWEIFNLHWIFKVKWKKPYPELFKNS